MHLKQQSLDPHLGTAENFEEKKNQLMEDQCTLSQHVLQTSQLDQKKLLQMTTKHQLSWK